MDFLTLAKERYSVRFYSGRSAEPEKLEKILEAARVAPSAANMQPVRLLVVQSMDGLSKVEKAANIYSAPAVIIVCADHARAWTRSIDHKQSCDVDAAIAADHMMLEAASLGLGSVWIGAFNPDILREEFHIPDNLEPVSLLAIGYAAGSPASPDRHGKARIPMSEFVFYENL